MKTVTKLWENLYLRLGQINLNRPLENAIIKQTMRPAEYKEFAEILVKELNVGDSVLEIGCAYGGQAQEILKKISVSYTAIDTKLMLKQAKRFSSGKVEYIEAEEIETIQNRKFELFISHFCLSETPYEYREYILKNIIKNCQKISVIDYDDYVKPTVKMIADGWDMGILNIERYLREYFIIKKSKYKNRKYFVFTGERKK